MDEHAQGERALVSLKGKLGSDLRKVGRLRSGDFILEEFCEVSHGTDDISSGLYEAEVREGGACLVEVGQVDVVPVRLERVALAFDVVGEGSAFSEWVAALRHKRGLVLFKGRQLSKGGSICCRVLF